MYPDYFIFETVFQSAEYEACPQYEDVCTRMDDAKVVLHRKTVIHAIKRHGFQRIIYKNKKKEQIH